MPKKGVTGVWDNTVAVTKKCYVYPGLATELNIEEGSYLKISHGGKELILWVR